MDWKNIGRTMLVALLVIIGTLLPLLTIEWWTSVGVAPAWAILLGTVMLGLAGWWRKQQFEPGSVSNLFRTLMQGLIVVVGVILGAVSTPLLMSLGVDSSAAAIGGAIFLALAAWWRQQYPLAFESS